MMLGVQSFYCLNLQRSESNFPKAIMRLRWLLRWFSSCFLRSYRVGHPWALKWFVLWEPTAQRCRTIHVHETSLMLPWPFRGFSWPAWLDWSWMHKVGHKHKVSASQLSSPSVQQFLPMDEFLVRRGMLWSNPRNRLQRGSHHPSTITFQTHVSNSSLKSFTSTW